MAFNGGLQAELDQLHTWKESATLELQNLQKGARSAAIWAAAVDERTKDSCPKPVPPILKVEDLVRPRSHSVFDYTSEISSHDVRVSGIQNDLRSVLLTRRAILRKQRNFKWVLRLDVAPPGA